MPKLRCARATVDAEEERTIRKRDARRHVPGDGIRRARMVARSCEGLRTGAIAVTPGGQPQTVRARRARFNRRGRGGRRRNLMDKWAWIAMVGEEKARQDMGGQAFRRYVRAFNELSSTYHIRARQAILGFLASLCRHWTSCLPERATSHQYPLVIPRLLVRPVNARRAKASERFATLADEPRTYRRDRAYRVPLTLAVVLCLIRALASYTHISDPAAYLRVGRGVNQ